MLQTSSTDDIISIHSIRNILLKQKIVLSMYEQPPYKSNILQEAEFINTRKIAVATGELWNIPPHKSNKLPDYNRDMHPLSTQ